MEDCAAKFLKVLQSLYQYMECCIRINVENTDWFPVKSGLKQGYILSPSLFNLYLNGMVTGKKRKGLGVEVDSLILMVALLLYADDFAILTRIRA